MDQLLKHFRNRYFIASDALLLVSAVYISYVLRLDRLGLREHWPGAILFTALVVPLTLLIFWRAGIYSRDWRYASIEELVLLAGGTTVAVALAAVLSKL